MKIWSGRNPMSFRVGYGVRWKWVPQNDFFFLGFRGKKGGGRIDQSNKLNSRMSCCHHWNKNIFSNIWEFNNGLHMNQTLWFSVGMPRWTSKWNINGLKEQFQDRRFFILSLSYYIIIDSIISGLTQRFEDVVTTCSRFDFLWCFTVSQNLFKTCLSLYWIRDSFLWNKFMTQILKLKPYVQKMY